MTDHPETLAPYRTPWRRDQMKQLGALAPMMRYVPKNPILLIGAAVLGVAGVLAWRNREKIATAAGPMIEDARAKGQALVDDARAKGEELIEQARTTGEAVVAKTRTRRRAASETGAPELH
jgi:predicted negative regulator of RcsB-dependent stress response